MQITERELAHQTAQNTEETSYLERERLLSLREDDLRERLDSFEDTEREAELKLRTAIDKEEQADLRLRSATKLEEELQVCRKIKTHISP